MTLCGPTNRVDTDPDQKSSLEAFKTKIKRKPVSFWSSAIDLHGTFSIALMKQITSTPRPGWQRATDGVDPDVINELSRLSSENAELRKQLQAALHQAEDDAIAERRSIIQTMRKNNLAIFFHYRDGDRWEDETEITLYRIFGLLAPEMMIEKTTEDIAQFIGIMLRPDRARRPREGYPVPSNTVKQCISDFITLGLFEPSQKRHTVRDTKEYWTLTDIGREVYTDLRRPRLEKGESESTSTELATSESDESQADSV